MSQRIGMILFAAALIGACQDPTAARNDTIAVRDCAGPASSLSAEKVAALPGQLGAGLHDQWATYAAEVPGGFAGIWYENPGQKPILMLTRPAEAAGAKAALEERIDFFPIASAEVRQARWDFQQLVQWKRYLTSQSSLIGFNLIAASESHNRLILGGDDPKRLAAALVGLDVPCRLAIVIFSLPGTVDARAP
jgi:hypothetical protein